MASKSFDVSKFRKTLTKSIEGIGVGFNDPTDWVSTGNYALNYLISGDFFKGIPLGKVTMFSGESGCLPASAKVTILGDKGTRDQVEVTVGELKTLVADALKNDTNIQISTPDGFQKITEWFDRGSLPMVLIRTQAGLETKCAKNHLIQRDSGDWEPAGTLKLNDDVLTVYGRDVVAEIKHAKNEQCFDFTVDHENHRYWGDRFSSHNSGKSYICSGNLVRNAQAQGIFVVLIDSENALDESWLKDLGVDTSPEKLLKLSLAMIDDVARTISEFMKEYKAMDPNDRPKVLFVVDSLGMLLTPTDLNQFAIGELKGDLGRRAKQLTALIKNTVNLLGSYNVGFVATNHSYDSQDPYNPDPKVSGGSGMVYASSIVVAMKKRKLKEDEDGAKVAEVLGIRAGCKIMKTRYSKPFEDIELQIPYSTGMNPLSGLFELIEKNNLVTREGNRYTYVDLAGNQHKYFRKEWNKNINGIFDLVMKEYNQKMELSGNTVTPLETEDDPE